MLHKIPGVDKKVCTCEQMLAYNYASCWAGTTITGPRLGILVLERNNGDNRYNWGAVAHLLDMYLDKYRAAKYHILTNYAQVGEMFPIHFDD